MNPLYKGVAAFGRTRNVTDEGRLSQPHPHTGEALRAATVPVPNDPANWITWEVPALVPEDVWEAAQARLTDNRRQRGGNPKRVGMLAGRRLCPACGGPMTTSRISRRADGGKTRMMACLRHRKRQAGTGEAGCAPDHYDAATAEGGTVDAVADAAQRPEEVQRVIADALAEYNAQPVKDAPDELPRSEAALRALSEREAAAVRRQIAGVMAGADPAFLRRRVRRHPRPAAGVGGETRGPGETGGAGAARQEWTAADFPRILADVRELLTDPTFPGDQARRHRAPRGEGVPAQGRGAGGVPAGGV